MRWQFILWFFLDTAAALYEEDEFVVRLNETEFVNQVESSLKLWVVEFYTPNCERCQVLAPEFSTAAKEMKDLVHFGAIDVSEFPAVATRFGATEFPILFLFIENPQKNPYNGKMYREKQVYAGKYPITARGLKSYVKKKLPNHVKELTNETLDDFIQIKSSVVLFTSKERVSPMFKALAIQFHDRGLQFGQVSASQKELVEKFQLQDLPALFLMNSTLEQPLRFTEQDGKLTSFQDIYAFLVQHTIEESASAHNDILSKDDLEQIVVPDQRAWILSLQGNPQDNQHYIDLDATTWTNFRTEVYEKTGVTSLGAIDCASTPDVCEKYGGPGLIVFPFATTTHVSVESLDDARQVVEKSIPDNVKQIYNPDELQHVLAEAQQSERVPIFLLTKKETTPMIIRAISAEFATRAVVAMYSNPTEEVKTQLAVKKLPAIVSMIAQPDNPSSFSVLQYNRKQIGPMNFINVARFVQQLFLELYPTKAQDFATKKDDTTKVASDEVPYMTTELFEKNCVDKGSLCAIAFLQGAETSSKTQHQLETIRSIALKTRQANDPYEFMWVDGVCQSEFAAAFDVEPMKIPTLAVFSPKKLRYTTFAGALDEKSGRSFLRSVVTGRIGTSSMSKAPVFVDRDCSALEEEHVESIVEDDTDMESMMQEILEEERRRQEAIEAELKQEAIEREEKLRAQEEKDKKKKNKKKKKKKKKKRKKKVIKDEL